MSVAFTAIGWNRQKKIYDLYLLALFVSIFATFCLITYFTDARVTIETLLLRGSALVAVVFLHLLLAIGPLARIDFRFRPLLYNRRHMGVFICVIALFHAVLAVVQFHLLGNIPARVSVLESYFQDYYFWKNSWSLAQIPFEPFGLIALVVLVVMASTSHDFWLKHLGSALWKRIHLLIYLAYFSLILHISFGFMQSETNSVYALGLALGAAVLGGLHFVAFLRDRRLVWPTRLADQPGYHVACDKSDLREGKAQIVDVEGQRVAIFLYKNEVYAVENVCRHQGGPLGEGRVIDGCVTCPWHGWQYQLKDGRSPPPFQEVIQTFSTLIEDEKVLVKALPRVEPDVAPVGSH